MSRPILKIDHEFDLMVNYQITIESKSTISEDIGVFFLYEIIEPYPSYDEYLHCNEFDEGKLIMSSEMLELVKHEQEIRRCINVIPKVNDYLVES